MSAWEVTSQPIPWKFETNTQGANRAHDAWCHLQQVQVTFGSWVGTARYGVRGKDVNGFDVDISKLFTDDRRIFNTGYEWSIHDRLRIARDMMEWVFYAESVFDNPDGTEDFIPGLQDWPSEGVAGTGLFAVIQYRYTPASVNVGTEQGSVETFDYSENVLNGPNAYANNGIPTPYVDYRRN